MGGKSIPRSIPPSGLLRSTAGSGCRGCFLEGYSSGCGARCYRRIRQLTTPVDNSLDDTLEIVTVHDPTHPLYGKRFLVASRPTPWRSWSRRLKCGAYGNPTRSPVGTPPGGAETDDRVRSHNHLKRGVLCPRLP